MCAMMVSMVDSQRRSVTIREVAKRAGVAISTASRALSGGSASQRTREKVERAAQELSFVPNVSAQRLSSGRSNVVAIVVPESPDFIFADSFVTGVISHLAISLTKFHLQPFLDLSPLSDTDGFTQRLEMSGAEGLVIISAHQSKTLKNVLKTIDKPIIFIGKPAGLSSYPFVDVDNYRGGALAAECFISKDRNKVAVISGPVDMLAPRNRTAGFVDTLRQHDIEPLAIEAGTFERSSGALAMHSILERSPEVDAVFAHSDEMAAGALQALTARGKKVPADVSIIGFDNFKLAHSLTPQLTTIAQPLDQLAKGAAVMLEERLRTGKWGVKQQIYDVQLVHRESV